MSAFVIDDTHDPALQSWVESANAAGADFPIQNLPFGRFKHLHAPMEAPWRLGVAIGDQVLDLQAAGLLNHADMNRLMGATLAQRQALRQALSAGLKAGSAQAGAWSSALVPMTQVRMGLPCHIGDYTDFYVGIHHATAVGRLMRPDNPLLPNYTWVPIGYHGRASTIVASGTALRRPHGQVKPSQDEPPVLAPSRRLDFELELGLFIGQGNAMGESIALAQAESHLFGVTLFNDWSARDVQAWEYQPLGPFLAKNFASSVSPWLVTMEALAPYRRPHRRDPQYPAPLAYLQSADNDAMGALDIELSVSLQTAAMQAAGCPGEVIVRSNYADAAFWSAAQLVTHHTVNGCALQSGDLLGTGTLSGAVSGSAGSMLELSAGGKQAIKLANGEQRTFLEDGDTVTMTACCDRPGWRRIGFGQCAGTVLPAR